MFSLVRFWSRIGALLGINSGYSLIQHDVTRTEKPDVYLSNLTVEFDRPIANDTARRLLLLPPTENGHG